MEITEDMKMCREGIWDQRMAVLDTLMLCEPDCFANQVNMAGIRLVGWNVAAFKVAVLLDDRSILDVES